MAGCNPDKGIWEDNENYICDGKVVFPVGSNVEPVSGRKVSFLPNILSLVTIDGVIQTDSVFFWSISNYVPVGKQLKLSPLGALKFRQEGKIYHMIVLNAMETQHNVLKTYNMEQLAVEQYAVLLMLQDWFLHANPDKRRSFIAWEDEFYAIQIMNNYQED